MSDSYDVTVSRTNESGDKAEVISIGRAYMVTSRRVRHPYC